MHKLGDWNKLQGYYLDIQIGKDFKKIILFQIYINTADPEPIQVEVSAKNSKLI